MRIDPRVVKRYTVAVQPVDYIRVTQVARRTTPLGMGFGSIRFASPDNSFKVFYIAQDLETGIPEAIIRDRFEGVPKRTLPQDEVDLWGATNLTAREPLTLLDLRTDLCFLLGISTDAVGGKSQAEAREFSRAVYRRITIDGLIYDSRLRKSNCIAVYDRAVPKLIAAGVIDLRLRIELLAAMKALRTTINTSIT